MAKNRKPSKRMLSLKVWGDFACFTRPEMKVERVSYDVMTPSAARGVLEAIFWKPQMRWVIHEIDVLKPIQWTNIRRNEVGRKIPVSGGTGINASMKKGYGELGMFIEDERQQRAGLLLKDVEYIIHAEIVLTDKAGDGDNVKKYQEMYRRRLRRGQCFHQPYLGCREFAANFKAVQGDEEPLLESQDLGLMLLDLDYSLTEPVPRFFQAVMVGGKIVVPPMDAETLS